MPGAVRRKEAQINLKKQEIQLMVKEFKKDELDKILAQRRVINNRRTQLKIVELSKMLLKRFNKQKYHLERIQEIKLLNEKLYKLREHVNDYFFLLFYIYQLIINKCYFFLVQLFS